ncbi:MAG TPA: flagellar basal body rod C-terminal domain-containing protein [Bryobacteraceae bacterium]|nr:flagellar basal body rod C-terminal domain-containing protein [Bryobacteraceae bacterium]
MTIGMISSLQGIHRAETQFNQAAENIAQDPIHSPADQVSLSDQAVALLQAKNSFEANTAALKVGDEMTQSLLKSIG